MRLVAFISQLCVWPWSPQCKAQNVDYICSPAMHCISRLVIHDGVLRENAAELYIIMPGLTFLHLDVWLQLPEYYTYSLLPQLTVYCHTKKGAPCEMGRGSATGDHRFAYFTSEGSMAIHRYEFGTGKWEKLPLCPYGSAELVVINGALTAVGGWAGSYSNQLFTLRQGRWVEEYPPMDIKLSHVAAVSTFDGHYVFVIGGLVGQGSWTARVNMLHVRTNRWYSLTNLPQTLHFPSATICGNELHVVGICMEGKGNMRGDGYSCSLQDLLFTDQPVKFDAIWTPLPALCLTWTTAATLCGQLVIVGGFQGSLSEVDFIYQLRDGEWVEIGSLSSTRRKCLVVSSAPDKLIVVGGYRGFKKLDTFEECVVYK